MKEKKIFNPKNRAKLNDPRRLEWVPPAKVAQHLNMKADGVYADLGAGTGYLSRFIGECGNFPTIHALDIEPIMVEDMQSTLKEFSWIRPALIKTDELPFADMSIDGIWCITVFHEFKNPEAILREIFRVLKPGGKLLVIDWLKKPEACKEGPPIEHRIAKGDAIATLQDAGFSNVSEVGGFVHHFGILATKD